MCFGGGSKSSGPSAWEITMLQNQYNQQVVANAAIREQGEAQARALQEQQQKFNDAQTHWASTVDALVAAQAAKTTPDPAPPAALLQTGAGTVGADTGSNADELTAAMRKGRAGLRIDLNTPTTAGNTGLNIPRG